MKNLFVGNLSYGIDNHKLQALFSPFGEVHSANVVMDRLTGHSKGFGFVSMDVNHANDALRALHGKEIDGRALTVNEARPREVSGNNSGGPYGRSRPGNGPSREF
jgi:cold-inducible RNA-binding protein